MVVLKKWLKDFRTYIALIFIAVVTFILWPNPKNISQKSFIGHKVFAPSIFDVVICGGSRAFRGVNPEIIEAMKLFNEIESEVAGKIVKVLVDDASPVEYDQPLFLVEPA